MSDEKHPVERAISGTDSALNELLHAEKSVAEESLRLARRRFDTERSRWEKLLEAKQREILELRHALETAEAKIRSAEKKLDEERESAMDRIRAQAAELETQRLNQSRRWAMVEEEIKKYRAESDSLRKRLEAELSVSSDLRRAYSETERNLKEELKIRDDAALEAKEKSLSDEQAFLREKHELKERISALESELASAVASYNDEKLHREKLSAKKDEEIKALKESLLEKIKVITQIEEARLESDKARIRAEERLGAAELELSNLKSTLEEERRNFIRQIESERASSAASAKETAQASADALAEQESRASRLAASLETLEKNYAEEKQARAAAEEKLAEVKIKLQEKTVAEGELKHRLYTLELERNSEINRHDSEISAKEREIRRLESMLERRRLPSIHGQEKSGHPSGHGGKK